MSDHHNNNLKRNYSVNKEKRSIQCGIALLIILILFDQFTKLLARVFLQGHPVTLIPGVFQLHYLENHGAAFGIMKNMQWFFILAAILISIAAIIMFIRSGSDRRFLPLRLICVFVTAGAIGNMIDRCIFRFVTDFLYFSLIDFPIFNVADIYVCVSTFCFLALVLFYYKDDDFDHLLGRKTKKEYISDIVEKINDSRNDR